MIDPQTFATWMGVFADVVGRPLAAPTQAVYYASLSRALTTDQFQAAAQLVLERHRYNVWPKPGEFIAAVQPAPAPELAAGEMWERVAALALAYRPAEYSIRDREAEIEHALGAAARRALQAAGGVARLRRLSEGDHEWIRKEFTEHFATIAETDAQQATVAALTSGPSVAGLLAGGSAP